MLEEGLDADGAVAVALKYNPELQSLRHEVAVAEGELLTASEPPNPKVVLGLRHLESVVDHGPRFALRWEPPQPFEVSAKKSRAVASGEEAKEQIAEHALQLTLAVRTTHATLLSLEEEVTLLARASSERKRLNEAIGQRLSQGAATRFDVDVALIAFLELDRERHALEAERDATRHQLVRLLGVNLGPGVVIRSQGGALAAPAPTAPVPELAELEDRALSARPEVRAGAARYEQREQSVELAYLKRVPWFRITAGPAITGNRYSTVSNVTAAIEVSFPLWNWNDGQIQVAEARRAEEADKMAATVASLRRDLADTVTELGRARSAVTDFQERVLPTLTEHERLLATAHEAGQYDLLALILAEEAALRSRRDYLHARLRFQKAWLSLDRLVGEPLSLAPLSPGGKQ